MKFNALFLLLLAVFDGPPQGPEALTNSGSLIAPPAAWTMPVDTNFFLPSVVLGSIWTNKITNLISVVRVEQIATPCPECGGPNHHERRISLVSVSEQIYMPLITFGGARTNNFLVGYGPTNSLVVTSTVLRVARTQPGSPPPLP